MSTGLDKKKSGNMDFEQLLDIMMAIISEKDTIEDIT